MVPTANFHTCNGMRMDPFVVFPAEWAAAGFEIHATPPTLSFPSGYIQSSLEDSLCSVRSTAGSAIFCAIPLTTNFPCDL